MPEQDLTEYSRGINFYCTGFVVFVLKQAGIFGDLKINGQEFTPRDLYQLKIYDLS